MSDGAIPENRSTCCSRKRIEPSAVVHLPVAPQLVARTRFSPPPPGRNQCITIAEGMELLHAQVKKSGGRIGMAAITGPGDPLATPEITIAMSEHIKKAYPTLNVGLLTYGLGSRLLATDLAAAGVSYVEMKVEAVRSDIVEKLFAWIRPGSKTVKLSEGAALLVQEQRNGVSALAFHDISVSIVTTLYPGFNTDHVAKISGEMAELGAESISLIAYSAEPNVEVDLDSPTAEVLADACARASASLPVTPSLFHHLSAEDLGTKEQAESFFTKPSKKRPNVAVVSSNGIEVDLHLGQAIRFLIYGPRQDGLNCLLETRNAPEPGTGSDRWLKVARILADCSVLLTASAGETPRRVLAEHGLRVWITEENIEGCVDGIYGGGKKKKK